MSDDSPKVVSIRTGDEVIPPGEPRLTVIEMCEDLLERAKSGELMGLATARLHSDGSTSSRAEGRNNYALVGTLAGLQQALIDDLEG